MKFNHLVILAALLSFVSCKKDPLPVLPDPNAPYYSVRGLVNGDSINWVVGIDEATITHGVSEMNSVQTFYGQINSPVNDMALKVEILRPEIFFDGTSIAAIQGTELHYLVHKQGAIKFNFGINYSQFNYLLVRDELNNYVVMDEYPIDEFGIYNVGLKFTDFGPESFIMPIKYGFEEDELIACFNAVGDGNIMTLNPETLSATHAWYINDEFVSDQPSFSQEMEDGIYSIRHKIRDANSNESEYTTLIRFKDGQFYWQLKYYYVPPSQPTSNFGRVTVSVLKDGIWYSSEKTPSNIDHQFSVSDIETVISQNLQPMWTMFDFVFESTLYNENHSDSLYLPEMVGTLNVALK